MTHPLRHLGALLSALLISVAAPASIGATVAPAVAATVGGQIVFDHGDDIWAANPDGSGAHVLVTAKQVGMDHLGEPATAPDGKVLLFTGWTDHNEMSSSHGVVFWGNHWHGTYELRNGVVRRLSPKPAAAKNADGSPRPIDTSDYQPEPSPDGVHYVYAHVTCTEGQYTDSGLWGRICTSRLRTATLAGGTAASASFASACDSHTFDLPTGPALDPVAPRKIAYAGCQNTPADQAEENPESELAMSGPAHKGQHPVGWTVATRNFVDPSFSPDGATVVADNPGGELTEWPTLEDAVITEVPGGIYAYDSDGSTPDGRLVVAAPDLGTADAFGEQYAALEYPRYLGPDTIGFVYAGSVYAVPASCSGCAVSDAKKIHNGGSRSSTQASSLAWTARSIAPLRKPTPHPSQRLTLGKIPRQHARTVLKRGVGVAATCRLACRLTMSLTVTPKQARKLRLISKHQLHVLQAHHRTTVTIGRAGAKLRAGRRTSIHVKLTKHARKVFRHKHAWSMRLTVTPGPGGTAKAQRRTVRVRK